MQARVIDWPAIHRRLAAAAAALSEGLEHSPEDTRRILIARARLASKLAPQQDDRERLEILTFSLAGETHGVETRHVREVCQLKDLTTLPGTPPFIAGVMNLRSRILAIVDLRKFFEIEARGLTELNLVIVLRDAESELGLLADSIDGVREVIASDLQEDLPTLTGIRAKFLRGVTRQSLAVLDGGRLLSDESLKVNDKVNV